jgi:glucose-1-phosphate thymidylyltransferase
MKAILLAGGSGTRLYPMTAIVSKQLQPVYDKPMIFYPLSLLMLCGIREFLIISTERDTPLMQKLLGDGSAYGIQIAYEIQKHPRGLSDAFIIGEKFIGDDNVTMVLGDNLFHGDLSFLERAVQAQQSGSDSYRGRIFGYYVDDPRSYGVIEFEKNTRRVLSIEEKPKHPKSNYAIPGIYVFDNTVAGRAKALKPSTRGEIEIVDLMKSYEQENTLGVEVIGRGVTWFDTGTPESLLEAGLMISSIEKRSGVKIACLEEIALRRGFLSRAEFVERMELIPVSPYRSYLQKVYDEFVLE